MIITRLIIVFIAVSLGCSSLPGCKTEPLEADFIAEPTEVAGAAKIQFTDLSQGAIRSWAWDFENDGIIDSVEQNPVHTYKKNGDFSVTLTITGAGGKSSITKERYINVSGCGG